MERERQGRQNFLANAAKLILNPQLQMEEMFGRCGRTFLPIWHTLSPSFITPPDLARVVLRARQHDIPACAIYLVSKAAPLLDPQLGRFSARVAPVSPGALHHNLARCAVPIVARVAPYIGAQRGSTLAGNTFRVFCDQGPGGARSGIYRDRFVGQLFLGQFSGEPVAFEQRAKDQR